jgi:hypothetical protein
MVDARWVCQARHSCAGYYSQIIHWLFVIHVLMHALTLIQGLNYSRSWCRGDWSPRAQQAPWNQVSDGAVLCVMIARQIVERCWPWCSSVGTLRSRLAGWTNRRRLLAKCCGGLKSEVLSSLRVPSMIQRKRAKLSCSKRTWMLWSTLQSKWQSLSWDRWKANAWLLVRKSRILHPLAMQPIRK